MRVASSSGVGFPWITDRTESSLYFYCLDPPIPSLGFIPATIQSALSEKIFVTTFAKIVSAYYKHGNLDSKDYSQLAQVEDPSKIPTSETMTPEELLSIIDFAPSFKCDIPLLLPTFSLALSNQMSKALVDPQVREDWGGVPVWHIVGEHVMAIIQSAPWLLEAMIGSKDINFKLIKDANHFVSFFFLKKLVSSLHHGLTVGPFLVDVGRARSVFDRDERMYASLTVLHAETLATTIFPISHLLVFP